MVPARPRGTLLRAFWGERSGNVAVTSALCMPLALALAAAAVDESSLYGERRALQNLADLAAIAAAASPGKAEQAVLTTLKDNGLPAELGSAAGGKPTVLVVPGRYANDPAVGSDDRFKAGDKPTNAFRVTVSRPGTLFFAAGLLDPPTVSTEATGYASAKATFSVGSRLASLNGGVVNAVLGALLGGKLSLNAMDYRALADARIDVLPLLDRVAVPTSLKAGTYADVLDAETPVAALFSAMAATPGLDRTAAAALRAVQAATPPKLKLRLASVFNVGTSATLPLGGGGAALAASAADILRTGAAVANGDHQAEAVLGAALPGILDARLQLAVGERQQSSPWLIAGEENSTVRTAQTRLLLRVQVAGPGGALGTTLTLPVYAELAFAEAKLAGVACAPGQAMPSRVTVSARPGIAELRIADLPPGQLDDFRHAPSPTPAVLAATPLARATGSAFVSMAEGTPTSLAFSTGEIAAGTTKTVATRSLLASPTASLLDSAQFDVKVLGLGAGLPSTLTAALSRSLQAAAKPVDEVLAAVLDALGVSLGEADVTVTGGTCNRPVLVQ